MTIRKRLYVIDDRNNAAAAADCIETRCHCQVGNPAVDPSDCTVSASDRLLEPAAVDTVKSGFPSAVELGTMLEGRSAVENTARPSCCQIGMHCR